MLLLCSREMKIFLCSLYYFVSRLTFLTAVGEFLSQIYGMDSIIINQLMFGITGVDGSHLGGHVQNMETKERWGWRKDQIETYDGNSSIIGWITKKLGAFFKHFVTC